VSAGCAGSGRKSPVTFTLDLMTIATPDSRAERFSSLDVHDDTVEAVELVPGRARRESGKLRVTLFRHWENKRRILTFHDCENIQMNVDSKVLADNGPNSTCDAWASADPEAIASLMRSQRRFWNVKYQRSIDPMAAKLSRATDLVLFRVRMFGGTLNVVARTFTVRRASMPATQNEV
jgi:hypothetical protein